ncbi:putative aldehyde dehydrogenase [Rhizophagus irregularis]|uniref:Aldehyde dehydrogenase (NADP(+)) ALD4 n=4 Tax=Rhizophagus irregularis TaxID=588596 RepID=A0A015KR72_RHIIW|nr:putative aldehyde dehydrogenase [Rhizophagus irregularis DAOM 181602=DAOM 197198]EXX70104.1 aldehyde dehydrogenase (NADP(+)) ALD4 [Rhizophagus irregularis DAOM 197198w]PKC14605.1 putative aldehyde dehydrogenase [Rhizophagus irregularis]PKC74682.1 putative aldehyde dehydrogenase [Rhizophagus irregularis]PKK61669.1 putative aldehyde dehydrogenase [Rhizophagus irregularis]PKY16496.1 putative aldehyde dehydrogenase [Rhizophagus irregularis]|eukprot:XP_025181438.1 putative aldehyde dehydrogenase [Rhizophagus irregularis DAOM 181602=DAOM 197198]
MSSNNEQSITLPTGKTIKVNTGLFINNEFVDSIDGKRFETINPATEKVITTVAEALSNDVDKAIDIATETYVKVWSKVSGYDRGRLINKLADLMERDIDELAAIESLDNGKPFLLTKAVDIQLSIKTYRYYAGFADKINGELFQTESDKFDFTQREPYGVIGAIIPWNFPIMMQATKLAPILACGNTIVLKTSEFTPLSALKVAALIKEAGFPKGVVNILSGYGPTAGAAMASHMKLRKITFTGSVPVGKSILKASAESNLKKVTLELGGKSPNIIFADSDIDEAVKWAHMGIYFSSGQVCVAGSRIYVQDSVYDEFLEKFKKRAEGTKVGDPFKEDTFQGPQVSQIHYNKIMSFIEAGKKEGATLLIGGEREGEKGYYIKPTIFTDTNEKMSIMQEEIFGPVAAISKFSTVEEVIEKAHLTRYGLAAAVFTKDITRALKISKELNAGTVWVNCYGLYEPNVPFGGYRESGIGREGGESSLNEYTQVKSVQVHLGKFMF